MPQFFEFPQGEPPANHPPPAPAPSRRSLLRALAALPASAVVLGELPGLLGTAAAAPPASGSATRYTIVPFLDSDDGTVDVYQSDDATDFRLVKASARDSYDTFATWSTPKALPGISGTARHFTVVKETVPGGASLTVNATRSFRSANYPTRYWQEQSALLNLPVVTASSATADKQAATFTVVAGLADAGGYSFRDASGNYLRHYGFRDRFDADDGTATFAKDATFIARVGSATGSVRLESYNYPGHYLRHYGYQLRVEVSDGTDLFRQDSSFVPMTAWGS
ncbi:AbfB domain-containing protein [Streptomyces sp. NPDC001480]|uniref:AbfB domain-containing protein n=1 Tax=Streptomyces sp. NPDC001480 TaxID=3364577 RepID=UPI0036B2A6F9